MISTDTPVPGITRVTIELPPVNALDTAAIAALTAKFRQLSDQPPAQGVILTGAGKAFCAGVDTRAFAALNHDGRLGLARAITRMTAAIVALPCPLVAMVNGHALGGGLILALCADWRIASEHPAIRLGLPEAQAGVPFPSGPMAILQHLLPGQLVRRMALSSFTMAPAEMLAQGIIDELCPAEALLDAALARIAALASQPGFGIVKQQTLAPLRDELDRLGASGNEPYWDALR